MADYLTTAEYVERYGNYETTVITNETPGAGVPDDEKVATAISDATEVVEGYIGARYTTPLTDVPRIVKGFVAALARERLYTRQPPDAVKQAADLARIQLREIRDGKLSLPIAEGEAPPVVTGSGLAQTSGDRTCPTFTPQRLDGFLSPFTGGGYAPNWRQGQ